MNKNVSIYDKRFNYGQVKAICEVFKYREQLEEVWYEPVDYENIIELALKYYDEWKQLADLYNGKRTKAVYNEIGNEVSFINEEEYTYEQSYVDRRIQEDYLM